MIIIYIISIITAITYQEAKKMTLTDTIIMFVRLLRACFRVNLGQRLVTILLKGTQVEFKDPNECHTFLKSS